ncbi:MAG: hypothetical protein IPK99_10755 [Flavobacteriales bacterium]|nr:hypothetical protein [Flavobacteriales bacterium]
MSGRDDIAVLVIIAFLVMLLLIGTAVLSMIIVYSRRHRHRSELAEVKLLRDKEVMAAEREATQQTLGEVGRELHDNVAQLLTVAEMGLYGLLDAGRNDPPLRAALDALEEGIEEVRRLGRTLNSDTWQHRSFLEAVSGEAAQVERMGQVGAPLILRAGPDFPPIPRPCSSACSREIMSNALRHAHADDPDPARWVRPSCCASRTTAWASRIGAGGGQRARQHPSALRPDRVPCRTQNRTRRRVYLDHSTTPLPWRMTWPWWTTTT